MDEGIAVPERSGKALLEARALTALALPLIGAQLAQMGMGFVDTVMTGRLGAVALAAVALGNSLWNPLFLFCLGVLLAVTATLSPLVGAGRLGEIGEWVRQGLWLALALMLPVVWLLNHADGWLRWVVDEPAVVVATSGYLRALSLGAPAFFAYLVLRCLCESLGRTRVVFVITSLGLLVNVVANYALIFGRLGAPALGATGCGLATALTYWVMFLFLGGYVLRHRRIRPIRLLAGRWQPQPARLMGLLGLGIPIGVSIFLESGLFAAVTMLLGGFGPVVLAGHQIALNVAALTFMVPLGLSQALTVRVGRAFGRRDRPAILWRALMGIGMAGIVMAMLALLIAVSRWVIVGFYTEVQAVQVVAARLLLIAAVFQVCDGLQIATAGVLRGLKDTCFAMGLALVGYWGVGFPVAYLGTQVWFFGATVAWWALAIGVSIAAVGLIGRFWWFINKKMI